MMKKYVLGFAFMVLGLTAFSQVTKADAVALMTRFKDSSPTKVYFYRAGEANIAGSYDADRLIAVVPSASGFSISYSAKAGVGELFVPYSSISHMIAENGILDIVIRH